MKSPVGLRSVLATLAMARPFRILLVIVLVALTLYVSDAGIPRTEAVTCPAGMVYGETIDCSIASVGEEDSYTFSGTSGDKMFIKMVRESGLVNPKVRIERPDMTELCIGATSGDDLIKECILDATGTHTLLASDNGATDTGDYSLHLQRTDNPVGATAIAFDQTLSGTIALGAETDAYTFSGTTGDDIYLKMVRETGSVNPIMRVYRPDGSVLCTAGLSAGSSGDDVANDCALDATGTHTVLAGDANGGAYAGDYSIHVQRANNPVGATAVGFGDTLSGTIALGAETDAYTFSGASGDWVFLKMVRETGSVNPIMRVYRPDGSVLCTAGLSAGSSGDDVANDCALDATGTHTVLAGDANGGAYAGDYSIHVQRTNNPVGATAIAFWQTLSGTIALGAETDAFTFSGTTGDYIYFKMVRETDSISPVMRVYRPDGSVLCTAGFASFGGDVDNECALDATGTHTVLAGDWSGMPYAGDYSIHVQRMNNPVGATAIAFDQTLSGTIALGAETDAFTFSGTTGDYIYFKMVRETDSISPVMRVYRPDGSVLCTAGFASFGGDVDNECALDATGTHTVLAGDWSGMPYAGDYSIHVQRMNSPVNATAIGYLQFGAGAIGLGAEVDAYTFVGVAGDEANLSMSRTSGSVNPVMRVYRPDGSRLCTAGLATLGDDVTGQCILDIAGQHTVLAGDWSGVPYAGTYVITLGLNMPAPILFDPFHWTSNPSYPVGRTRDPINTVNGDFTHEHTDLFIPGRGSALEFTRYYHSGSSTNRSLGVGWTHNYDIYLTFATSVVNVFYVSGYASEFVLSDGVYVPRPGITDTLVDNGDGTYTLTRVDQIAYTFSSAGVLESIADRNGNTTTLVYTGGLLTSVTDAGGRSLTFEYDASNRIKKVTDPLPAPDTRTVEFTFDANNDLTDVQDVKGGTTTYAYSGDHRMTSLTDANNNIAVQNIYDSAGRAVEQRDALLNVTCVYYGTAPTYTSVDCPVISPVPTSVEVVVVDPRGNKTTHTYDEFFRLTDTVDALGGTVHQDYNADHQPSCVTDQLGFKTAYVYDSNGNVLQMIDALNTDATCQLKVGGVDWTYTYTNFNDADFETDPLGRDTDYVYNAAGNLTELIQTDDLGSVVRRTCYTRDSAGLITEVINSITLTNCTGPTTKFEYDQFGNQQAIINARFSGQPTPPKTTITYDLAGRTETVTNELGHTITNTYDAKNGVLTSSDNLNNTTSNTYDATGASKSFTDANRQPVGPPEAGAQCGAAGTGDGVDDDGDTVTDDGCPSTIYSYDGAGRLTDVIDVLGQTTSFGYDASGNRTSTTNANRQPVSTPETGSQCGSSGTGDGVDDDGDTFEDDGCPSTVNEYDDLNRFQSITDSLGRITSHQYDATGDLIQRTDARGLITKYIYDAVGRLTDIDHYLSDGTTLVDSIDYTHDAVGNRLTMIDPTGTTSYDDYDALNRLKQVTFPGAKVVSYQYDNVGDLQRITYPDAKFVDYTYDEAHNMETVTDWLTKQTAYAYDDAGGLIETTYPTGVSTSYTYDLAGRLLSMDNSKGGVGLSSVAYTLDSAGMRTSTLALSQRDHEAVVMNEQPAAFWRLGETAGTVAVDETANGLNATYIGSPVLGAAGAIFGDTDTAVGFDGVDDVVQSPTDSKLNSKSFSIELWAKPDQLRVQGLVEKDATNSWRLFMNDTAGHIEFDALNDTQNCSTSGTDTLQVDEYTHIVATFDDAADEAKIYLNGTLRATCSISDMGGEYNAPVKIGAGSSNKWDGQLDDAAYYCCPLKAEDVLAHYGALTTYENDEVNRLTEVAYPNGDTETFTYDAMGNRLTRVFNGSTTSYTYDAGQRIETAGGVSYTYDENGNLTDRGTADDFGWDHENHLTSTTINNVNSTYDYNGDGLRMSRTIGATTTDYVWNLAAGLPVILEDSDGMRYVYGLDLIARIDGSSEEYYLADGLGSATALTDDTGNVTVEYAYDAFGNYRPGEGSSTNEFTYAGEQVDETGLQYLRARYYDPVVGRFLSEDPLPFLQRYSYVSNNPVNLVDPSGLCGHPWSPWNCADEVVDAVVGYVDDKAQDAVSLAAHCWVNRLSCPGDVATFALSLTCVGDRQNGPGGWAYYENVSGGCEFMFGLFPGTTCYTPGYLTFCADEPGLQTRCHEYQHYIQSRLIPSGLYWVVATTPFAGERDATAAGNDKESRVPFTSIPWPIQCN